MKELVEALEIFLKYGNPTFPTHCEHDQLWVVGYDPNKMENGDVERLDELGFSWNDNEECFISFKYGSC